MMSRPKRRWPRGDISTVDFPLPLTAVPPSTTTAPSRSVSRYGSSDSLSLSISLGGPPPRRSVFRRKKRKDIVSLSTWLTADHLKSVATLFCVLFAFSFGIAFLVVRLVGYPVASSQQVEIVDRSHIQRSLAKTSERRSRQHVQNIPTGKLDDRSEKNPHDPISDRYKFTRYSTEAPSCTKLASFDQMNFTLVTQFSEDRMWMMEYHCQRWVGNPFSISVLTEQSPDSIRQKLREMNCPVDSQFSIDTLGGYPDDDYPVNILRNRALRAVTTTHVVYVDVDFWVSHDLVDMIRLHGTTLLNTKEAIVLPAFQLNRQCREWRDCREKNIPVMPHTKSELLDRIVHRKSSPFDPTNLGGHGSTRYMDWFDQPAEHLIPIECFKSNRYEPYLVFRYCHDVPPFQEAFSGYGKNKMTWVMQMRREGWKFWQLGDGFVVHYPHLDSKSRMRWNGGENGIQLTKPNEKDHVNWTAYKRGQIDKTFVDFKRWLDENIPDKAVVPLCDDALNDDEKLWIDRDQLKKLDS